MEESVPGFTSAGGNSNPGPIFNGQSTVRLAGDTATGESYTIAHHVYTENGVRKFMIASLRYLDDFVKHDGTWLFSKRQLILDWSDTRALS